MNRSAVDSLAAVLAPRSVRVLPARAANKRVFVDARCRRCGGEAVDLAVLAAPSRLPEHAASVLLLEGAGRGGRHRDAGQLLLGPGAGLWTSRVRAGIEGSGKPSVDRGWLLLCQGCGVAEQVLRAASSRGLPIRAALATGTGGLSVLQLASLASELPSPPGLLIALHRPGAFAELLSFGLQRPRAVLLITATAETLGQVPGSSRMTTPSASQLARSLGLPVTGSPEQLAAAAELLDAGVRRRKRFVLGLAPRSDEAALLADALGRAGMLRAGGAPVAAVVRTSPNAVPGKALRSVDAAVVVAASGELPRISVPGARSVEADAETLRALTALLEPAVPPSADEADFRSAPAIARRAGLFLDAWPAELSEVEVKRLLGLYGLRTPEEELTSSASAAARVAAHIGYPVAVKPAGPGLCARADRGALRLHLQGAASVRQAFRDVLDACARMQPSPPLTGVLVSRMVPLPFALEVSVIWPAPAGRRSDVARSHPPPVLFACRRRGDDEIVGLPCPISLTQADWAADKLLGTTASPSGRKRMADWLRRLSSLAPDLSGRMCWLRLDTVTPPVGTDPPLIIDGAAMQTASLRDPLGLRGGGPVEDGVL